MWKLLFSNKSILFQWPKTRTISSILLKYKFSFVKYFILKLAILRVLAVKGSFLKNLYKFISSLGLTIQFRFFYFCILFVFWKLIIKISMHYFETVQAEFSMVMRNISLMPSTNKPASRKLKSLWFIKLALFAPNFPSWTRKKLRSEFPHPLQMTWRGKKGKKSVGNRLVFMRATSARSLRNVQGFLSSRKKIISFLPWSWIVWNS